MIRLIQSTFQDPNTTGQTNVVKAFTNPVNLNSLLFIVAGNGSSTTDLIATLVDSLGNRYTKLIDCTDANSYDFSVWWAISQFVGTPSITATFETPVGFPFLILAEYAGVDLNRPIIGAKNASGSSAAPASGVLPSSGPDAAQAAIVGVFTANSGGNAAGSRFTVRQTTTSTTVSLEDNLPPAPAWGNQPASVQATGSITSDHWACCVVALRAAVLAIPSPLVHAASAPVVIASAAILQGAETPAFRPRDSQGAILLGGALPTSGGLLRGAETPLLTGPPLGAILLGSALPAVASILQAPATSPPHAAGAAFTQGAAPAAPASAQVLSGRPTEMIRVDPIIALGGSPLPASGPVTIGAATTMPPTDPGAILRGGALPTASRMLSPAPTALPVTIPGTTLAGSALPSSGSPIVGAPTTPPLATPGSITARAAAPLASASPVVGSLTDAPRAHHGAVLAGGVLPSSAVPIVAIETIAPSAEAGRARILAGAGSVAGPASVGMRDGGIAVMLLPGAPLLLVGGALPASASPLLGAATQPPVTLPGVVVVASLLPRAGIPVQGAATAPPPTLPGAVTASPAPVPAPAAVVMGAATRPAETVPGAIVVGSALPRGSAPVLGAPTTAPPTLPGSVLASPPPPPVPAFVLAAPATRPPETVPGAFATVGPALRPGVPIIGAHTPLLTTPTTAFAAASPLPASATIIVMAPTPIATPWVGLQWLSGAPVIGPLGPFLFDVSDVLLLTFEVDDE